MTKRMTARSQLLLVTFAVAAAARPSPAQVPFVQDEPAPRGDAWQLAAGGRNMLIRGAGFDPFSTWRPGRPRRW